MIQQILAETSEDKGSDLDRILIKTGKRIEVRGKKEGRRYGTESKNSEKINLVIASGNLHLSVYGERGNRRRKFIVEISAHSYYYMDIKERNNV